MRLSRTSLRDVLHRRHSAAEFEVHVILDIASTRKTHASHKWRALI